MARRRRSSREGGRLRDPGDQGGQLRVGAADERLDTLLEEAKATSMPPAVKRVGGAPAAIEARRSSAAASGAGGRQPGYASERQDRGAGWQETVRQSLEVLQRAFGPNSQGPMPVGPPPPEGLLGPLFHGRDPGHPRDGDPGQPGGQGAWQREAPASPQFPFPPRADRSSMNGARVLEPYDMSTPHQHGRQQTKSFLE